MAVPSDLAAVRSALADFHHRDASLNDGVIDGLFGLRAHEVEGSLNISRLLVAHGDHRLVYGDLGYAHFRTVFRLAEGLAGRTIVDLGSGYGRAGFYSSILFGADYLGIEIVPERVREATRVARSFGLPGLRFECGDACITNWPEAELFLVMNSFCAPDRVCVIERLRLAARDRPIAIAGVSTINLVLEQERWLVEPERTDGPQTSRLGVRLFVSR